MQRLEWDDWVDCIECGDVVSATADRVFQLRDSRCLCFRCALDHGARFDDQDERWVRPPRLTDQEPADAPVP